MFLFLISFFSLNFFCQESTITREKVEFTDYSKYHDLQEYLNQSLEFVSQENQFNLYYSKSNIKQLLNTHNRSLWPDNSISGYNLHKTDFEYFSPIFFMVLITYHNNRYYVPNSKDNIGFVKAQGASLIPGTSPMNYTLDDYVNIDKPNNINSRGIQYNYFPYLDKYFEIDNKNIDELVSYKKLDYLSSIMLGDNFNLNNSLFIYEYKVYDRDDETSKANTKNIYFITSFSQDKLGNVNYSKLKIYSFFTVEKNGKLYIYKTYDSLNESSYTTYINEYEYNIWDLVFNRGRGDNKENQMPQKEYNDFTSGRLFSIQNPLFNYYYFNDLVSCYFAGYHTYKPKVMNRIDMAFYFAEPINSYDNVFKNGDAIFFDINDSVEYYKQFPRIPEGVCLDSKPDLSRIEYEPMFFDIELVPISEYLDYLYGGQ